MFGTEDACTIIMVGIAFILILKHVIGLSLQIL